MKKDVVCLVFVFSDTKPSKEFSHLYTTQFVVSW